MANFLSILPYRRNSNNKQNPMFLKSKKAKKSEPAETFRKLTITFLNIGSKKINVPRSYLNITSISTKDYILS